MIIPIKCFTCGKVIASKWAAYEKEVAKIEDESAKNVNDPDLAENFDKVLKGKILDKIGVERICCRRHILTHIDLVDIC